MRPFSDDEITRMRDTQQGAMFDECVIFAPDETGKDGYNMAEYSQQPSPIFPCGIDETPGREIQNGSQIVLADAVVRLPIEAEPYILARSVIQIVSRLGKWLETPLNYDVIGSADVGVSGLTVNLLLSNKR